jgi:hypothetical protein
MLGRFIKIYNYRIFPQPSQLIIHCHTTPDGTLTYWKHEVNRNKPSVFLGVCYYFLFLSEMTLTVRHTRSGQRNGRRALWGCAIAQAVTRWLPTAAARVRSRVWWSGIYGGQSGVGAGFLRSVSPANLHSTKFSILTVTRGRYNRLEVADVGLPPHHPPHNANLVLNEFTGEAILVLIVCLK